MAATSEDFEHLRVPLIIAAVLVAIGGGTVAAMYKWTERAKYDNVAAQMGRTDSGGRLERATEEEKEIRLNILQYRTLAEKGIIGDESRLDWIERLAAIKASRKLFDIHYEISEQKPAENSTSGAEIMMSKMVITLPLLHEEDLFNLLGDLRATPRGYFQVRRCSLTRATAPTDRKTLAPMLNANCELDFYTIREHSLAKVAGS